MNNYLSETQIRQISNACNSIFTKETKKKLLELGKKYGLTFDGDHQTNTNKIFNFLCNELKKDTSITFGWREETFAQRMAGGWSFDTQNMFNNFLDKNEEYRNDYSFIWSFRPDNLIGEICGILRESYIYDIPDLTELYEIDNYEKHFSSKYGIQSVDKKAIKATERVLSFFDNLLMDVPNKSGFLNAFNTYLDDTTGNGFKGNKTHFHNTLFHI